MATHNLSDAKVFSLKKLGFRYVTIVATKKQVAQCGEVVGAFVSLRDSKRFARALNKEFGTGLYEGIPL